MPSASSSGSTEACGRAFGRLAVSVATPAARATPPRAQATEATDRHPARAGSCPDPRRIRSAGRACPGARRDPLSAPHSVRRSPAGPTGNRLRLVAQRSCHSSANPSRLSRFPLPHPTESARPGTRCMGSASRFAKPHSGRRRRPDAFAGARIDSPGGPELYPRWAGCARIMPLDPTPSSCLFRIHIPRIGVAGAPLSGLVLPPRQAVAVAAAACPTLRSLAPGPVGEVNLDPGVPDGLVRRVPHRAGEPLGPCSNGITSSTPPRRSRASSPGAYRVPFSPASPPVPSGPCVSVGSVGFPEHVGVRGAASRTRMPMGIRRTCQLGEPSDTPPTALNTRVGRFAHLPLWR